MFYGCTSPHCIAVPIMLTEVKYYLGKENDTKLFAWC